MGSTSHYEDIFNEAVAYIDGNFSIIGLTIDDFCAEQYHSRRTIQRAIEVYGDTTWGILLQQRRLDQGKRLLETTYMMVEQIATAVGYSQPSQFGYMFKASTGETPTEYRRNYHNGRRQSA